MKRLPLVASLIFAAVITLSQNSPQLKPLTIKVQVKDCTDKYMVLWVMGDSEGISDTIWRKPDGNYYLATYKIKKPGEAIIVSENANIQHILIAPGYQLIIRAEGVDLYTLNKSKRITGIGGGINYYNTFIDSTWPLRNTGPQNSVEERVQAITSYFKFRDSIARIIFLQTEIKDPYHSFFYNKALIDNKSGLAGSILSLKHSYSLKPDAVDRLLKRTVDKQFLGNISNDQYLISADYKELIAGNYLDHLLETDYVKNSVLNGRVTYGVEKISTVYTGKVKQYALAAAIERKFYWSKNLEELDKNKTLFQPYLDRLTDKQSRDKLDTFYYEKANELIRSQAGKPATAFTLADMNGKSFSLHDFKGKVVYLDLWASWCYSCRVETPYLQKIFLKYRDDRRISFISIAVGDRTPEWKKAIETDKPGWLQLKDKDDFIRKAYAANLIPKFILIDKLGNIVTFDAPPPSDAINLEKLIDEQVKR